MFALLAAALKFALTFKFAGGYAAGIFVGEKPLAAAYRAIKARFFTKKPAA